MIRSPWVCRRCITALSKPVRRQPIRFQSTNTGNEFISPALLNRARSLTKEHASLSAKTTETFDSKLAKRIGELQPIASSLAELDTATSSLTELHALLSDRSTDPELRELAEEDLIATKSELASLSLNLKTALTPTHPFAALPCLIEIKPGVGGSEANLFAGDLLRMYRSYCTRRGLRASLLKYETTDGTTGAESEAPILEAILEIADAGAYAELRCESGVHRVQRVPVTEAKGRTHTSAVGVLVLPSIPTSGGEKSMGEADLNDPESDYYVNTTDVRVDVMRARGAGGQHVNTTDSAVRLTHVPTGTVVAMQDSRSQHKNREKAWNILRARLAQARREKREEEVQRVRQAAGGGTKLGRGDKVRTYNWGQQRVTDHRSGVSVFNLDDVMEGGEELERVMQSVRTWLGERDIEDLVMEEEAAAKEAEKGGGNGKGKGKK